MLKYAKTLLATFLIAGIVLFISCQEPEPLATKDGQNGLSKVTTFVMPAGASLVSANLKLYSWSWTGTPHNVDVHSVTADWTCPAWNDIATSFDPTIITSFDMSGIGAHWETVDITATVQGWLSGGTNFGLMLKNQDPYAGADKLGQFLSNDYVADPTLRPFLEIVTTAGTFEVEPLFDTYINSINPDLTYCSEEKLYIGYVDLGTGLTEKRPLVKFDIEVCTGSIGDFTFWDKDANGIFNGNDEPLPGVVIELKDAQNNVIATTTSDANGAYSFTGLCPGDYYVCYTAMPPGFSEVPICTSNMDNTTNNQNHCNCLLVTLPQPGGQVDNPNIDFGFKVDGICLRMPDDSPCGPLEHELFVDVDANGDVTVIFNQNLDLNDNSYGTTQVGWGANAPSGKNHKFDDLKGSDKAQFIFYDGNGTKVLDILVDYITAKSGTPSGYASLGVSGGDGKVLFPSQAVGAAWVLSATTTLADNLNNLGLCVGGNCSGGGTNLLLNSPPTTSNTSYNIVDPVYSAWNFVNGYTVKISHLAFGAAGFGNVSIGAVHNSPPKCGPNAHIPVLCGGTPAPETCADGKPKKLEMMYTGSNCISAGGTAYGPPCNNQASGKVIVSGDPGNADPVYMVAYDKQTTSLIWFQGDVALNGTFIIDATAMNKTRLGTNTIVKIYDMQGGTLISTVEFHTSCSQPLNVGDKFGSLEMTNYVAE